MKYQRRANTAATAASAPASARESQNRRSGDIRYVGDATGVMWIRQLRLFDFRRNAATPGLTCESTSIGGQLTLSPYCGLPVNAMYSTRAAWNLKTWNLSLGGTRGTHGELMQRNVHVYVTCAKRPTLYRRTAGDLVGSYGVKLAFTRTRSGSTHFVSATTAIFAVTESPKRWTVGVMVAYAFSGAPSPTDDPDGNTGRRAPAGAENASAETATMRTRFTPPLRATSGGGLPSAGTSRASRRGHVCARSPARRQASGSRGRACPSVPRARRAGARPRDSSGRPGRLVPS